MRLEFWSTIWYGGDMTRLLPTRLIGTLVSLIMTGTVAAAAEPQPSEHNKGVTLEGLARGLKSAAQNIEKEIPKAGTAIGNTVKTIMGKGAGKPSPSQEPARDKK